VLHESSAAAKKKVVVEHREEPLVQYIVALLSSLNAPELQNKRILASSRLTYPIPDTTLSSNSRAFVNRIYLL